MNKTTINKKIITFLSHCEHSISILGSIRFHSLYTATDGLFLLFLFPNCFRCPCRCCGREFTYSVLISAIQERSLPLMVLTVAAKAAFTKGNEIEQQNSCVQYRIQMRQSVICKSVRLWSLYEQKLDVCHSNGIASVTRQPPTQNANTRNEYIIYLSGRCYRSRSYHLLPSSFQYTYIHMCVCI